MKTNLLKKAIKSKSFVDTYPNISINESFITGNLPIHEVDRDELLINMFDLKTNFNPSAPDKTTTVSFASNTSSFKLDINSSDELRQALTNNIGYDSYQYKLDAGAMKINCITEELKTVVVTTSNDKTSGVYDFELDLTHHKGQITLYLKLGQIYIEPQFKDSTEWMDLTIAIYSFTSAVIYALSKILPKPYYFDIYVCADFYNESDENIANMILRELCAEFESLPEITPNQPAFIGRVIADMGY